MKIYTYIFFLFSCLASSAWAVTPLEFRHFTTADGLSSSKVASTIQDHNGYMWFGTYDGLNKFNGADFIVYRHNPNDPHSISGNGIRSIFEDSSHRLWISTVDGVDLYNHKNDSFLHFPYKDNFAHHGIKIVETAHNQLLVLCHEGLFHIDETDSVCKRIQLPDFYSHSIKNSNLRDIFVEQSGMIWITARDLGLTLLSPSFELVTSFNTFNSASQNLKTTRLGKMFFDKNGNIWITSNLGLYCFDRTQDRFLLYQHDPQNSSSISDKNCSTVQLDKDGNVWVTFSNGGIDVKKSGADKFIHILHDPKNVTSLNSDAVLCLYLDRQNNIWVGTLNGLSVSFHERTSVETFENDAENLKSLSNNNVTSFSEDQNGNLWITTDGGGLNYFNRSLKNFDHWTSSTSILNAPLTNALLCSKLLPNNTLLFGGHLAGLSSLDTKSKIIKHIMHSKHGKYPLKSDDIRAMFIDSIGDLWIATLGNGLFRFIDCDLEQLEAIPSNLSNDNSLPLFYCLTLCEDSDQNLWIGTYNGLCRYDRTENSLTVFDKNPNDLSSISGNWVYAIHEDKQKRLWIGTTEGLDLFDKESETFESITTADGLPSEFINAILEDDIGRLWLSTNKGLVRFSPDTREMVVFSKTDGFQGDEYLPGSALKLTSGEMAFGGSNGFSIFHPDSLRASMPFSPVLFTKIEFLNQPGSDTDPKPKELVINTKEPLVLKNKVARTFRIHYNSIEFKAPGKIRYFYQLLNYDNQWVSNGDNRTVTFMNLNPGSYTLNLAAVTSLDNPIKNSARLDLVILPAWWQTKLAYISYFILFVGIVLIYHFMSQKFVKLQIALEKQTVEKAKAQELEALKSQFFTNISHEFRTPLTLIITPIRELLRKTNDKQAAMQFGLMKKSAERLLRLVNQVIDMNKIESEKLDLFKKEINLVDFIEKIVDTFTPLVKEKQISFQFNSSEKNIYTMVDPEKIDIVVFNVLSNAFKFTPNKGEISVYVHQDDEIISIDIKDSGPGISPEHIKRIFERFYHVDDNSDNNIPGAGIGLALSKKLIELHGGQIVAQNYGDGALFSVTLPRETPIHTPSSPTIEIIEHAVQSNADTGHGTEETLLVVEDDAELRNYLKSQLETSYRILTAMNGKQGLEIAQKFIPDIILSDVMMPEMDGLKLCECIKQNQLTSHIPIILLTAKTSELHQLEGLKIGADDYITKPFNLEILKVKIQNLLKTRQTLR